MISQFKLAATQVKNDLVWGTQEAIQQIRALFAPKLTNAEFNIFTEMGKSTGLNPFLREIWAVKYSDSPAQIFIGRDGYRKSAQNNPAYDYHLADAVYSNDKFKIANGEVSHEYDLKDRGVLVGGYCVVQRKGSSRPSFVYVDFKEYDKKQSVWKEKPATMIKKVAEAQALRSAFQELFAGTYHEYEDFSQEKVINPIGKGVLGLKEKLNIVEPVKEAIEADVIEKAQQDSITLNTIEFLLEAAESPQDMIDIADKARLLPKDEQVEARKLWAAKQKEIKLKSGS